MYTKGVVGERFEWRVATDGDGDETGRRFSADFCMSQGKKHFSEPLTTQHKGISLT
jgi:hypothetical protein